MGFFYTIEIDKMSRLPPTHWSPLLMKTIIRPSSILSAYPAVWLCLLLVLATVTVYGPVGGFDFVDFDDNAYVTENRRVQDGLTIDGLRWAFRLQEGTFFS